MDADDDSDLRGAAELANNRGGRFHGAQSSDGRYFVKRDYCEIANRQRERHSLQSGMLSQWVKQAIEFAGSPDDGVGQKKQKKLTQAGLGRKLTQALGREIDRAAVNKLTMGTRALAAIEMLEVSRITGFPIPDPRNDGEKLDRAALWESYIEMALSAAFSSEAALSAESLSDPRIAQGILGEIRKAVAAHGKIPKRLANDHTLRQVVYYSVQQVLDQLQRETAEAKQLSRRSSPSNHDEKEPPKW